MNDLFNLGDLLDRSAAPDSIVLIDLGAIGGPREYSHGDLDAATQAVARGLVARATAWAAASKSP